MAIYSPAKLPETVKIVEEEEWQADTP